MTSCTTCLREFLLFIYNLFTYKEIVEIDDVIRKQPHKFNFIGSAKTDNKICGREIRSSKMYRKGIHFVRNNEKECSTDMKYHPSYLKVNAG